MIKSEIHEFPEGLTVIIPRQGDGKKLKVKPSKFQKQTGMNKPTAKFTFKRGIINIGLVDSKEVPINDYDPPIILLINFTEDDKNTTNNKIKFAFWDEGSKEWITFKEKHNFKLHNFKFETWAGFGVAFVKNWIDPPIALGT